MALRYLTVNYRHSAPTENGTLEAILRSCIEAELVNGMRFSQAPSDRIMIREASGQELLLNEFADVTDGVAGIICEVIPGLLQPVLNREMKEKQLTQKTVSNIFQIADQAAGIKRDFVQGLCYFYVRHNHLLFITLKGFRKADTNPFFSWLLNKLNKGDVQLNATIDRAQVGDNIGRVSKFRIRGRTGDAAPKGAGVALGIEKEVRRRVGAQTVAWSKAEEVVKAVLPQQAFDNLMNSLGEKNSLVADVQWSVAGPRGQKVKEAIQEVVTELANMDDGIVGVVGKNGEIKDGSVILEEKRLFEVALENTILIDFDQATDTLVSTFSRWIEDQKIVLI